MLARYPDAFAPFIVNPIIKKARAAVELHPTYPTEIIEMAGPMNPANITQLGDCV